MYAYAKSPFSKINATDARMSLSYNAFTLKGGTLLPASGRIFNVSSENLRRSHSCSSRRRHTGIVLMKPRILLQYKFIGTSQL
jgi:hypothetical protein